MPSTAGLFGAATSDKISTDQSLLQVTDQRAETEHVLAEQRTPEPRSAFEELTSTSVSFR